MNPGRPHAPERFPCAPRMCRFAAHAYPAGTATSRDPRPSSERHDRHPRQSAAATLGRAVPAATVRDHAARALRACVRSGDGRAPRRSRCDRQRPAGADVREHGGRVRSQRPPAPSHPGHVRQPVLVRELGGPARGAAPHGHAAGGARQRRGDARGPVPAPRCTGGKAPAAGARRRAGAAARAAAPGLRAIGRAAARPGAAALRRDRAAPCAADHHVRPERAARRIDLEPAAGDRHGPGRPAGLHA